MNGNDFGRVAISCRLSKSPDARFVRCWGEYLWRAKRPQDIILPPPVEYAHHRAAEMLAVQFRELVGYDTLMLIDDDMVFEPQDVNTLIENPDNFPFGMVAGLACASKAGHGPVALRAKETEQPWECPYECFPPSDTDGTVEVGMVGLAFTLIRRSTFQLVDKYRKPGALYFGWGDLWQGEDDQFCRLARKAGVRIGLDCARTVGHRLRTQFWWRTAEQKTVMVDQTLDRRYRSVLEIKHKEMEAAQCQSQTPVNSPRT